LPLQIFLVTVVTFGAAMGLAAVAPTASAVVLVGGLVCLLALPDLLVWWERRRAPVTARRWLDTAPGPIEVAFVAGGPGRVADVVVAALAAEGRVVVDADALQLSLATGSAAELAPGGAETGTEPGGAGTGTEPGQAGAETEPGGAETEPGRVETEPGRVETGELGDAVVGLLGSGEAVSLGDVRYLVGRRPLMRRLWDDGARAGLLRSWWVRNRGRNWLTMATFLTAVAVPLPFAFGAAQQDPPPGGAPLGIALLLVAGAVGGPFAILAFTEWRRRRLPGYGNDPRTPAGLHATGIARREPWAARAPWSTALDGLRSPASQLFRPGRSIRRSGWWIGTNGLDTAGDDGTGWTASRP